MVGGKVRRKAPSMEEGEVQSASVRHGTASSSTTTTLNTNKRGNAEALELNVKR